MQADWNSFSFNVVLDVPADIRVPGLYDMRGVDHHISVYVRGVHPLTWNKIKVIYIYFDEKL